MNRILTELAARPSMVRTSIMEASEREVQEMTLRFQALGREHLDVPPVYLGHCAQFRILTHVCTGTRAPGFNLRVLASSAKMKRMIIHAFARMPASVYELHELRGFFEPNPDPERPGYVPKMVTFRQGRAVMFDVDHIVPIKWDRRCCCGPGRTAAGGGFDHPRNYVVMHHSMNSAFCDRLPEIKMAYIEKNSNNSIRRVHEFVTMLRTNPMMVQASAILIRDEMPLW